MSRPLTPLALAVLRMLSDEPMHPYQMQQRIREYHYDHAVKVTHGSLYHSVERLAAGGYIEPVQTGREGRRPERTVYAITEAGRDEAESQMREILARPIQEYPIFGAALAFINLLSADDVAAQLRSREVALQSLAALHDTAFEALRKKKGLERYKLIDLEFRNSQLRAEIDYVQALAEDIEAGRLTWEADANEGIVKEES